MKNSGVENSTIMHRFEETDCNTVLSEIIVEYGLPEDSKLLSVVEQGVLSRNWIIGNEKSRYFLKRYRKFTEERVREIHATMEYFSNHGIPIIMPLKRKNGSDYWRDNDGNSYALFPYVAGKQFERRNIPDDAIVVMAETLAKIHRLSLTNPMVITDVVGDWDDEDFLERAEKILNIISSKQERNHFDELVKRKINQQITLVNKYDLRFSDLSLKKDTLCHGDYQDGNIFFAPDNTVESVFDFEKCDMEPRIYEVLRAIDLTIIGGEYSTERLEKAKIFLRTYDRSYPLVKQEIIDGCLARYIKQTHDTWIEEEYYLRGNERPMIYLKDRVDYLNYRPEDFAQTLIRGLD